MDGQNFNIVPTDKIDKIFDQQQQILATLKQIKLVKPDEYFRIPDFLSKTGMSRSKLYYLREKGLLKTIRRGKLTYIPAEEVDRYFAGDMEENK